MRYNGMPMLLVRHLRWDAWNEQHIARHRVNRDEVEEVCHGPHIVREGYRDRVIVIGPSAGGRMLAAILEPLNEAGHYYTVTARPASRKERRLYNESRGGQTG